MRVITLNQRPKDDGVIDWIWVRNALAGSASCAADLTRRELIAAVHLGVKARKTGAELADLLLIHARQVDRYRRAPWPTERLTAAATPAVVKPLRPAKKPATARPHTRQAPVYQQLELIAA